MSTPIKEEKSMIPKNVIERAIAGGWGRLHYVIQGSRKEDIAVNIELDLENSEDTGYIEKTVLDPDFWMALGKEMGDKETWSDGTKVEIEDAWWYLKSFRFYDLILRKASQEEIDLFWDKEPIGEMLVIPSPRIDWCGDCQKEHGYDCPKDAPTHSKDWEAAFDEQFPRFKNRAFTEDTATVIKSFMADLLETEREKAIQRMDLKAFASRAIEKGRTETLSRLKGLIEGMMETGDSAKQNWINATDLLSKIEKEI